MSLVMFDFDGVIVDSLGEFTSNFLTACREAGYNGLQNQQEVLALFDVNVYEALKNRGLEEATINKILQRYEELAGSGLDEVNLFDGMKEALVQLCKQHKVYIITSNVSSVPSNVLAKNDISCIVDVLGADKEKSKITKIRTTMSKHPELVPFYVGDTKGDIIEGRHAGAKTIGAAWGWHGAEKLKEVSPDHIVYCSGELVELLAK